MSNTLKKTAKKLADIMMKHLSTLDPQDRTAKIEAGKRVLRSSATATADSSAGSSGRYPKGSSSAGTVRLPLAARGR